MNRIARTAIVVGGSLTGLCAALKFAHIGFRVIVLEKKQYPSFFDVGITVDLHQLTLVTGHCAFSSKDETGVEVYGVEGDATTWWHLYRWLIERIRQHANITVYYGKPVTKVLRERRTSRIITNDGCFVADLVLAADGPGSVVKSHVNREHVIDRYAGYYTVSGLVDENDLSKLTNSGTDYQELLTSPPYRLVTFPTPLSGESPSRGARAISWTWYLPHCTAASDIVEPISSCKTTLFAKDLGSRFSSFLREEALARWSDPYRSTITESLDSEQIEVRAALEYSPERLGLSSTALIGEAAHSIGPVTGESLAIALDDITAIGTAITMTWPDLEAGVEQYHNSRIETIRNIVRSSMRWSDGFVKNGAVIEKVS